MASGHAKFEFTSKLWVHSNVRRLNHSGVRLLMPRKLTCFDRYYSKDRIRQEIKRRRRRRRNQFSFFGRTDSNIGTRYSRTKFYNVLTYARFERPTHERTYFNLCEYLGVTLSGEFYIECANNIGGYHSLSTLKRNKKHVHTFVIGHCTK